MQAVVRQPRPIAADRLIKPLGPIGFDAVINVLDPFNIRPEARLPAQVQGHVHTQSGALRGRIHQVAKRRPAAETEITALAQMRPGNECPRQSDNAARHLGSGQPRAVDQFAAAQRHGLTAAHVQLETLFDATGRQQRRVQGQRGAEPLGIAL
ncbi:hypothetical protein D3C78_1452430 [compost metagenome]